MKEKKKNKKDKKSNKEKNTGENGKHVSLESNGNLTSDNETLNEILGLSKKELVKRAKKFSEKFRVTDGKEFRLKDIDPSDDNGLDKNDKAALKQALGMGVQALADLQDVLYAQDRWAVLLIFQAMDAAGASRCAVFILDQHPAVGEFGPVHAAVFA